MYGSSDNILAAEDLQLQVSLSVAKQTNEVHYFDFQLLKYSLEGEYLGFEPLSNQLLLCPSNDDDGLLLRKFANSFTKEC